MAVTPAVLPLGRGGRRALIQRPLLSLDSLVLMAGGEVLYAFVRPKTKGQPPDRVLRLSAEEAHALAVALFDFAWSDTPPPEPAGP